MIYYDITPKNTVFYPKTSNNYVRETPQEVNQTTSKNENVSARF